MPNKNIPILSLRDSAASALARNAYRVQTGTRLSTEHLQQDIAFIILPELPHDWKPFLSSLFDTVRVVVKIAHTQLDRVAEHVPCMSRNGFVHYVRSPCTDAKAQVISRKNCKELIIEFSIPKFLTGQNLVGIDDIHAGCKQGIRSILGLMGIKPTSEEIRSICAGNYRLTRVDFVSHIDCGNSARAFAMMRALRGLVISNAKDFSVYGHDTIYVGQHSRRRSLKVYRKDNELIANPMPLNVYGHDHLMLQAEGLVRLELVLRRDELAHRGLDSPLTWTPEIAQALMTTWSNRLRKADGCVPDVARVSELSPMLQHKFHAWLYGDAAAFSRNVGRETQRSTRNTVLKVTGIDVDSNLTPVQQRAALLTIRKLFDQGYGYRDHANQWSRLVEG